MNYDKLNGVLSKLLSKLTTYNLSGPCLLFFIKDNDNFNPVIIHRGQLDVERRLKKNISDEVEIPYDDVEKLIHKHDSTLLSATTIVSEKKITIKDIDNFISNGILIFPYTFQRFIKEASSRNINFINDISIQNYEVIDSENINSEQKMIFDLYEIKKDIIPPFMEFTKAVDETLKISIFGNNGFTNNYQKNITQLLNRCITGGSPDISITSKVELSEMNDQLKFNVYNKDNINIYKDFIKVGIREVHAYQSSNKQYENNDIKDVLLLCHYIGMYQYTFYSYLH